MDEEKELDQMIAGSGERNWDGPVRLETGYEGLV